MSELPAELPGALDAAAALASWAFGELVKRAARGRPWETTARRALPVLVPAVGVAVRSALETVAGGGDYRTAALRGAIAGAAAVYGQAVRTATIGGSVSLSVIARQLGTFGNEIAEPGAEA